MSMSIFTRSKLVALKPPLDLLYPLIVLAGFGFYVSLVPLVPNDYWWHLKIGELITTQGQVPSTNLFGWTLTADFPFQYGAWLGEFLLYGLYHWGGIALTLSARTGMILAALWLMVVETRRKSSSWRIAALALVAASLMSINNLTVRPQIWSWLPFAILFLLLNRFADGVLRRGWLLLCPVLIAFWVNVHGAFILGLVLMGIFLVGESLRRLIQPEGARTWGEIGWLGGIGVLSGLATLINPRFTAIFDYVLDLMTDKPSQRLIQEWQSPTPTGIANIVFFVSILLLIVLLAYTRQRVKPTELLLALSFLWLAWSGQRYVIWFGLVNMPTMALLISKLPIKIPTFAPQRNWINLILAGMIFIPMLLAQPWFVEYLPLPESYWSMVHRETGIGPLIDRATPLAATEYLRQHPGGKLFNEMGYGSYLIWALPEQGVFVDPRVELYPLALWEDYIRISNGIRYNDLLTQYGADRLMLDRERQKELLEALAHDPLWQKVYQDANTEVWDKR